MKLLAVFVSALFALCSGCATSHFDPPDKLGKASSPPLVNSLASQEAHTDSITTVEPATVNAPVVGWQPRTNAVAASRDVRAANLRFEDEPNPWLANLAARSQLTLTPADPTSDGTSETSSPLNPFSKAYVGLVWDDIKSTFTAPAHWETRDWLILGGVAAGVGTVAVFDEDIQQAVQRNRNQTVDDVFKHVQGFGNEYAPGVIGAFYVGGVLFDDPRAKSVALDAASASIIASGLVLYPLKYTVGRARPGDNLGAYHFHPFGGSDSFPSGHTTEAFALATVIAEHYHSIWIDMGCYGIASAVGYARLDLNYHWASDVLAGAAIGTFAGHLVVHVNHNRWGVAIQPVIGPRMNGAQISWSF